MGCILAALFCGRAANASVIMTLDQVGPNVVATGSGTVDLTDLTTFGNFNPLLPVIEPSAALLHIGDPNAGSSRYIGSISGPTNFGSGPATVASSGTGNSLGLTIVSLPTPDIIFVPLGYVSGTPLSGSTATWNNTTLAALGATPGIYTWTWGTGAHADSLTLESAVPEPAPALLLTLGAAGLAFLKWRSSLLIPKR